MSSTRFQRTAHETARHANRQTDGQTDRQRQEVKCRRKSRARRETVATRYTMRYKHGSVNNFYYMTDEKSPHKIDWRIAIVGHFRISSQPDLVTVTSLGKRGHSVPVVQCGLCTTQPIISQNDPFISVQFLWLSHWLWALAVAVCCSLLVAVSLL